jgi:protocatechuate 3,4-dioxygenase beta subunit
MRKHLLTAGLIAGAIAAAAADRATLTGKVTDNHGKPLDDATVMIYEAGVKKGYST